MNGPLTRLPNPLRSSDGQIILHHTTLCAPHARSNLAAMRLASSVTLNATRSYDQARVELPLSFAASVASSLRTLPQTLILIAFFRTT